MSADAGTQANATILSVEELVSGYGGAPIVHGVSLTVGAGEIVSIIGPNGSGKSTLLKSLVGHVSVYSGRVQLHDRETTNLPADELARRGVGYVPQVDDVFDPLTIRENLEIGGTLVPRKQLNARLAQVVDLYPKLGQMMSRRAGKLSGGERKMLAMGRVLMLQPKLFVLDEPTANLAPMIARIVLEEHVRQLAATGASILLVEQRAKSALAISDRTYVLAGGRCPLQGRPSELLGHSGFVQAFLGGAAVPEASATNARTAHPT